MTAKKFDKARKPTAHRHEYITHPNAEWAKTSMVCKHCGQCIPTRLALAVNAGRLV